MMTFVVGQKGESMRLIDADAFERSLMFDKNINDMQDVIYALRDYPTIDIEEKLESAYAEGFTFAESKFHERKKGKWIEHNPHKWGLGIVFECSECGETIDCEPSNFCPNCGADMRGDIDG